LKTRVTAKTVAGAAMDGASAIRNRIDRGSAVRDTRRQANQTLSQTQKQARSRVNDARRQVRRQVVRARIATARAQTGARTKASGVSAKAVGAAGAVGLAAGYFLDPESGKRRRDSAIGRAVSVIRRGADRTRGEAPSPNDQDLADRVKSQIFQPADAPKGSVNVNVENGVVYLRGEVNRQDEIRKLVEQAGDVDGVSAVESLLHIS
jgi:osmotically-inducible protein OsmY